MSLRVFIFKESTYNHGYIVFVIQLKLNPSLFYSQGDEGIALVCSGGLTGIMIQTNLCAVSSYPEIYTRVSNYTEWIRSVTGGASTYRPELTFFAILAMITSAIFNK